MYLSNLMENRNMTRAHLSRISGVPESTLRDILNGKTRLDRCEVTTVLCLAEALGTTVEKVMVNYWEEQFDDDWEKEQEKLHDDGNLLFFYTIVDATMFKLQLEDDQDFVQSMLDNCWIERFYAEKRYRCALFLLGLVNYLCRKHQWKLDDRFDEYQNTYLDLPVYSLRTLEDGDEEDDLVEAKAYTEAYAVPELARFNIFMTEEDIAP